VKTGVLRIAAALVFVAVALYACSVSGAAFAVLSPSAMARPTVTRPQRARASMIAAATGPAAWSQDEAVQRGAGEGELRVDLLLKEVDRLVASLPIEVPLRELKKGPPDIIQNLVQGLRSALEQGLQEWKECTLEACEIEDAPSELEKAVASAGLSTPVPVLTDLAKALRASGVDPPAAVVQELATSFLVEELVLKDLMDGLVVKTVDAIGQEVGATDYPEGVLLPTSWPAEKEKELFDGVSWALRKNGVTRWEAGAITSALRGDAEEDLFKTTPDRVLRDLRWALRGAYRGGLVPQPILRDLAIVLRSVGVQPRDPLVHDLAMALDVVSQLVDASVTSSVASTEASKEAWVVATNSGRALANGAGDGFPPAWRTAAARLRQVSEECMDECELAAAFAPA
jgi:hypothetical protein